MAQAIGLEPPESRLELLLDVDQQQFRCRVDATSEVGPSPPVSPLPRTPSWLVGLALAHERVVPVVDLVTRARLRPRAGRRCRVNAC